MDIANLSRDMRAVEEGVWVRPSLIEDAEFLVRAISPAYRMKRDAMQARLTRQHRTWEQVPVELRCAEQAKILFATPANPAGLVLDVRGVTNGEATVSLAEYAAHASTFRGEPALDLAFAAVDMATARRESDASAAEGNSSPSSATSTTAAGRSSSGRSSQASNPAT